MFTLFADLIAMHLNAHERVAASEAALLDERATAQLREQFIAVLGHDLRNPLNAITAANELLRRTSKGDDSAESLLMVKRGAARMAGLIDNLLDFARGRLGGGLDVRCVPDPGLGPHIEQVVGELRTSWPRRAIDLDLSLEEPVACDAARVGQMLSNLLGNALSHGDAEGRVGVRARSGPGGFEMSVTNGGETIPPHVLASLFKPFARDKAEGPQEGLGLGLYIAAEIARTHAGTLSVESADGLTCFAFRMPIAATASRADTSPDSGQPTNPDR